MNYVLVRRRDRRDVMVIMAIYDTDGWTDHRLVLFKMKRHLQALRRSQDLPAADGNASVEIRWCRLRDAVQSTALGILGRARNQHQGWLDENDAVISHLLAEKNRQPRVYLDRQTSANEAAFYQCRRAAHQGLRGMQDS
nr:unnamed protein product [Spirometra erinaceieuropaei]